MNTKEIAENNVNCGSKKTTPIQLLATISCVLSIIAVVLVGVCFIPFNSGSSTKKSETVTSSITSGLYVDPNQSTAAENNSNYGQINSSVEKDVVIPGWTKITVPAGVTEITTVDFYNPDSNSGYYNMTFELIVNGESICTTGLIEPGMHISKMTFSKAFSAGEYDAVLKIQPYRLDNTPTNNAEIQLKMLVQ